MDRRWDFSGLFTGHDPNPRVGSGIFVASSDRVGLGRVGSDRVGSGQEVFKPSHGSGRVTLVPPDPT